MRPYLLRIFVTALLFSLPFITNSIPKNVPPSQSVWFVASQSDKGLLYLDPLAKNDVGHLVSVPEACNPNDPQYKKFVAENFGEGQSYNIFFRGSFVGTAVFNQDKEQQESNLVADSGKRTLIPAGLSGLASTEAPRSRADRSRAVTPSEEVVAMRIAKESFKNAGVPNSLLPKITVDKLERTYLLPSRLPSLIGSFSIDISEQEGLIHSLFLIATKRGSKYHADFVWSKISRGETDNGKMQLVDHADIFGDGQDEVVVDIWYYENYSYRVYRREKNGSKWEQIFETGILGCE